MHDWYHDRLGRPRNGLGYFRKAQRWVETGVALGMVAGMLLSLSILALTGWPDRLGTALILFPCLLLGGVVGRRFGRFMNGDHD